VLKLQYTTQGDLASQTPHNSAGHKQGVLAGDRAWMCRDLHETRRSCEEAVDVSETSALKAENFKTL
jgi:hypothetical protein